MTDTAAETGSVGALELPRVNGQNGRNGRENGQPQQPTQETQRPALERAKTGRMIEGAATSEITLPEASAKEIAHVIENKRQRVNELSADQLSVLDRIAKSLTSEEIKAIERGEITDKNVGIVWCLLQDELLERGLTAGKVVREKADRQASGWAARVTSLPILNRFREHADRRYGQPVLKTQVETQGIRMSTASMAESRFTSMTPEQIEADLRRLDQLRINLEQSFFKDGMSNPLFELTNISSRPDALTTATRNKMQAAMLNELDDVLAAKFGGLSYEQLWKKDPVAATQALFEANQRALFRYSGEAAKDVLSREKPTINSAEVAKHTTKLREPAKPEDLTPLQTEATIKTTAYDKAKSSHETLKKELDILEGRGTDEERKRSVEGLNEARDEADLAYVVKKAILDKQITTIDDQLNEWKSATSIAALNGIRDEKQRGIAIANRDSVKQRLIQEKGQHLRELNEAELAKKKAESRLKAARKRLLDLAGRPAVPARGGRPAVPATEGLIRKTEIEIDNKKAEKDNAEKALKDKQEEVAKGNPENLAKADALEQWVKVTQNFGKILDRRFSKERKGELEKAELAINEETVDGQIKGSERIRRHILEKIGDKPYDAEQARKMISDETIARAILAVYKIDTATDIRDPRLPGGNGMISEILDGIKDGKSQIERTPPGPARDALVTRLRVTEKVMMTALLPYLREGTEFQLADLMQFIVKQGAMSAENGDPYLDLSKQDTLIKNQAEINPQRAETLPPPEVGEARIEGGQIVWNGDAITDRITGTNQGLHFRVTQNVDQENKKRVNFNVELQLNDSLISALPEQETDAIAARVPVQITNTMYENGKLRTIIRPSTMDRLRRRGERDIRGQWIQLPSGHEDDGIDIATGRFMVAAEHVSEDLRTLYGDEVVEHMTGAIGDSVMKQSPQERLQLLGGRFQSTEVINVPLTGAIGETNYVITLGTDGRFYIKDNIALGAEDEELNTFFQKREKEYRQSLGAQTLSAEQRKTLQDEFKMIRGAIGLEVARAQQRK